MGNDKNIMVAVTYQNGRAISYAIIKKVNQLELNGIINQCNAYEQRKEEERLELINIIKKLEERINELNSDILVLKGVNE